MFRRLELPAAWHGLLQARAAAHNLLFLSSCADTASADLLAGLGVPALKLASEDLINLPLLRHVAGLGRPVILSTGMAEPEEIAEALDILSGAEILLLHCVSLYPTPDGEANLRRIVSLRDTFGRPVGYSDHTLGIAAAAAATALGALMIEKHFTIDRSLPGPDHRLSADPAEMAALVATVRQVSRQSGTGALAPATAERKARLDFRRSIVASRDLPAGTVLETGMLVLKRPHTGLHPRELAGLLGRSTVRPLKVDQQLSRDDLASEDLASEDLASEDLE
jgi:N-acetylneuraminate synthase/N,N'-diacetyllegionaminate synthase